MQERINTFFEKGSAWQECMQALRKIVLQSSLDETMKWNVPCYMHEGKTFYSYMALNITAPSIFSKVRSYPIKNIS
jgi:uncharacterized protein YdeI (YjbR/CyaY-like superfamily)